jgi:hypothetical protein
MSSPLFDIEAAERARDEAITRVEFNASEDWKTSARRVVRWLALTREEFTTDPVWVILAHCNVEPPHEQRAMGAVMSSAAANGWIKRTDRTHPSARPTAHRRPLAIWRSLILGRVPIGQEAQTIKQLREELASA